MVCLREVYKFVVIQTERVNKSNSVRGNREGAKDTSHELVYLGYCFQHPLCTSNTVEIERVSVSQLIVNSASQLQRL